MPSNYTLKEKRQFAAHMRRNPVPAERMFFAEVRKQKIRGFRRQMIAQGWILDFYHPYSGVAVELDGKTHDKVKDAHRDLVLAELGIITVRIPNAAVYRNCRAVVADIDGFIAGLGDRREEVSVVNKEIRRDNKTNRRFKA